MKNVVLIIDNLLGGGAQRSTIKIATMFVDDGCRVSIVVLNSVVDFEVDSRINLEFLNFEKGFISVLSHIKYAKKLKKLLQDIEKRDGKINFLAGSLGLTHKLMDLASLSDAYYMLRGSTSHAKLAQRVGIKKFIKKKKIQNLYNDKKLLCVSKGVQADILALGVKPKYIETIYNPYDFKLINTISKIDIGFTLEDDYIVHVGRFSKPKRHDILLKSFAKLKDKKIKLVLVGVGEKESEIKELIAKLDLSSRIIFAGFQANPYPIIKKAKLLVLTSDNEGLPTVLIEALALGVKVVSTDCPSGPYEILAPIFEKYLTKVNDVDSFTMKVDEALKEGVIDIPSSLLIPFNFQTVFKQYKKLFN